MLTHTECIPARYQHDRNVTFQAYRIIVYDSRTYNPGVIIDLFVELGEENI